MEIIYGFGMASAVVEQDKKDIAVLKTLGMPEEGTRNVYFLLYGGVILIGMLFGLLFAERIADMLARGLVTSTGMPLVFPVGFYVQPDPEGVAWKGTPKNSGILCSGTGGNKKIMP